MEYLNVHVSIIRSPEYMGSEPISRATWWNLMGYCAEQENGGRISGAASWPDRRWQQTCGVTLKEVKSACDLVAWDGEDLVVKFYPAEKEEEVRRKREGGRAGGIRSGMSRSTPSSSASSTPSPDTRSTPSTERKGKERKGMEGNGEPEAVGTASAVPSSASPSASRSTSRPETVAEAVDYFATQGSSPDEAAIFFDHFQANGWRQAGKTLMRDWQAAARNWIRRTPVVSRGAAAGLGGGASGKNRFEGRGGGAAPNPEPSVNLPVAGLAEAFAEVGLAPDGVTPLAAAEGGVA